jgi:hypothetical protein
MLALTNLKSMQRPFEEKIKVHGRINSGIRLSKARVVRSDSFV